MSDIEMTCVFSPVSPQSSLEHDVYSRLTSLQEGLIPKKRAGADDELHRINELIQVHTHTPLPPRKSHCCLIGCSRHLIIIKVLSSQSQHALL